MIKKYFEFMGAHYGKELDLEIGQSYFVDGEKMMLHSTNGKYYKFVKGDKSTVVPEEKLGDFVIEKVINESKNQTAEEAYQNEMKSWKKHNENTHREDVIGLWDWMTSNLEDWKKVLPEQEYERLSHKLGTHINISDEIKW